MLRHGKTYGNTLGRYIGTTDEPLLPGEKERIGQFAAPAIQGVFASPMKRCTETAQALFPTQKPICIDGFKECDFGEFENKNYRELNGNQAYQNWIDSGGLAGFPGGESMDTFKLRTQTAFDEMVAYCTKMGWTQVAMIVHGGTIMALLDAYGVPQREYFSWRLDNAEAYAIHMQKKEWDRERKELIVDGKWKEGKLHVW